MQQCVELETGPMSEVRGRRLPILIVWPAMIGMPRRLLCCTAQELKYVLFSLNRLELIRRQLSSDSHM